MYHLQSSVFKQFIETPKKVSVFECREIRVIPNEGKFHKPVSRVQGSRCTKCILVNTGSKPRFGRVCLELPFLLIFVECALNFGIKMEMPSNQLFFIHRVSRFHGLKNQNSQYMHVIVLLTYTLIE